MAIQNYEEAERLAGPALKLRIDQTAEEFNRELNGDAEYSEAAVIKNEFGVEPTMMGEPYEMNADGLEYWSSIGFVGADGQQIEEFGIDIRFQLVDAHDHDGMEPGEEGWGVNVAVDVNGYGGEMLGGLTPHNYTDQVWTDDEAELEQRINYLDPDELVAFLFQQAIPDYLKSSLDDVYDADEHTAAPRRSKRKTSTMQNQLHRFAGRKKKAQDDRQPGQV